MSENFQEECLILQRRVNGALDVLRDWGWVDGDHHKAWVIDQAVRRLTEDEYQAWVDDYCAGEDGPDTYEWNEGIAP